MGKVKFQIKERPVGPAGWIDYFEGDKCLTLPSEPIIDGFAIRVPRDQEWKALCKREHAMWAIDRREIIINRIIEEMRKRYKSKDVTFEDNYWINVHFGPVLDLRGFSKKLKNLIDRFLK